MDLDQPRTGSPESPVPPHFPLNLHQESSGNDREPGAPLLTGTDHHALMELPPGAGTSWFPALSLELIDASSDHGVVGKERFDQLGDFLAETTERLPQLTEPRSLFLTLYAHKIYNIQILRDIMIKVNDLLKFLEENYQESWKVIKMLSCCNLQRML